MNRIGQRSAAYLDVGQGSGVTDGGRRFACRPGARLAEVLAAVPEGVRRLYLCGELPQLHGSVVAADEHDGVPERARHRGDHVAGDHVAGDDDDDVLGDDADADADDGDDPAPAGGTPNGYLRWGLDTPDTVCPGWQQEPARGHHLVTSHAASCVLRFRRRADGRRLDVCSMRGWFGDTLAASCTPADARDAFAWLTCRIAHAFAGAALLGSTSQTGLHTWRHAAEQPGADGRPLIERYPMLPEDLRALLHHTSGQGRAELFRPPAALTARGDPWALRVSSLSYYDGRLMYVASMAGLGVGPVMHDERADFAPYHPAWYRVRFTVPRDWRHPGILPVQVAGTQRGWAWPSAPGHAGETWASDREVVLACWPLPHQCPACTVGYRVGGLPCPTHGWHVTIRERLLFTSGQKPLDTWKDKLLALRDEAAPEVQNGRLSPQVGELVQVALRNMLVNGLGSFHRSRRLITRHARNGDDIPPGVHDPCFLPGVGYLWNETQDQPMDRRFTHPEWSVQVWGRCRARMLLAHGAPGRAEWTGMLALAPGSVVACKTDGLYLATDPGWPDDGRPGRLRLKRQLPGPISWPQDWAALADLKQHLDAQLRAQVETVEQEQIV